jgi:hypothetical protein
MGLVPGGRPARPARRLVIRPRLRNPAGPCRRPPPGTPAGRQATRVRRAPSPGPVLPAGEPAGVCPGRPAGRCPGRRVGSLDLPGRLPAPEGPWAQVSGEIYLRGRTGTDDNVFNTFSCARGGHGGTYQGRGCAAGRSRPSDRPGPAAGPAGGHLICPELSGQRIWVNSRCELPFYVFLVRLSRAPVLKPGVPTL